MDTLLNRNAKPLALLVFAALGCTSTTVCLADTADYISDPLLFGTGNFELANGETKLIADHKTPEQYHVCVTQDPGSVPVDVRYDGQKRTIAVGDCADITGKLISLAPAGHLSGDTDLIGKFIYRR